MNKIKIESGEYTEEDLLEKIEEAKVLPYEGCDYFYIWEFHELIGECGLPEDPSLHDEFAGVMIYP